MKVWKGLAAVCCGLTLLLSGCGAGVADTASDVADTASDVAESAVDTASGADDLTVLGFNAGKADAFLFMTPQSTLLIDCGIKGFGRDILAELEARGVEKLDCIIITHFDQDHVGGAARIINNFPVERILQSNSPKDSEEYEKYLKAVTNAGIEPETVRETLTFVLDGVRYTVNAPKRSTYANDASNNSSLIVSVENGENRLLFTGDAEDERMEEFLSEDWGTYDFLKVPHHGRWQETLSPLVDMTAPRYAVVTSSDDEPEDAQTLQLLQSAGVETYLTRNGAVTVHSDGVELTVTQ